MRQARTILLCMWPIDQERSSCDVIRWSVLCVLLLAASSGQAQYHTHYGYRDGLRNKHIHALLKEPEGYLWIATQEGLVRYDGESFRTYSYDPSDSTSLPHDHVEQMHRAPDGKIWITSFNGGITVYDPTQDRFRTWEQLTGRPDPSSGRSTKAVFAYTSDSIFVGTTGLGTVLYLPDERRSEVLKGAKEAPVPALFVVRDAPRSKALLLVSKDRSWFLHPKDLLTTPVPFAGPYELLRPQDGVTTVTWENDDVLWFGTWGSGLFKLELRSGRVKRYLHDPKPPLNGAKNIVYSILVEGDQLLLGTEKGLMSFDTVLERFTQEPYDPTFPGSLPDDPVLDLLRASDGVMWIGRSSGLSKRDPAENRFRSIPVHNQLETVRDRPFHTAQLFVNGRLLLATAQGDGLLEGTPDGTFKAHPFRQYAGKDYSAIQIMDLFRTGNGRIIVVARTGYFELDTVRMTLQPILPRTMAAFGVTNTLGLLEDHTGNWWVGRQHKGVLHIEPGRDEVELYGVNEVPGKELANVEWCQGIAEDEQHRIWVSLYGAGLDRIAPDRASVEHFPLDKAPWLRTNKIWDVEVDDQDRLWIGTNGQGLIITPASDPGGDGTVQLVGRNGPPSMISSVSKGIDGSMWLGGPSGLFRLDPTTLAVRSYGPTDGMPTLDMHHVSITHHPNGKITMPKGYKGILVADIHELDGKPSPPALSITHALVHGEALVGDTALDLVQEIVLPPLQGHLELRYAAIAFTMRGQIQLEHQLLGFDSAPVRCGSSGTAMYSALSPGAYTLVIRDVSDAEGEGMILKRIRVIVQPTVWQTWWFRGGSLLLLLVSLLFLARWRLNVIREREKMQATHAKRVSEIEMKALRAQMNPHFLFNSLNSINRYIVKNEPQVASEYLTKFSRLMRNVLQNSKEKLVPLKDELETLRLYIELESLRFTEKFEHIASIELEEDPTTIMIPPMLIQPYVENAIWHGLMHKKDGKGILKLRVFKDAGDLVVEIEDNGIGRRMAGEMKSKSATKQRSLGTQITQERMDLVRDLHGLRTKVTLIDLYGMDQRPRGTKVIIRMEQ